MDTLSFRSTNLVSNAVKFTDRGDVRVEAERGARRVCIHVVDTGMGIAPEHRERLFEAFFQVGNSERNRTKGFGLGLAIARRMARQMGGDVTLESAAAAGSPSSSRSAFPYRIYRKPATPGPIPSVQNRMS